MKIAQIAPIWLSVPPKRYGGTEQIISSITEELVNKGHEVTLFATGDSNTKATLRSFFPTGIAETTFSNERSFFLCPLQHMVQSLAAVQGFDIIHCHFTTLADFILLALVKDLTNCVFTAHIQFPSRETELDRWETFKLFKHLPFISISNSQRRIDLNFIATVYNGIYINDYQFEDGTRRDESNPYMFWLSRVSAQKGLAEAIAVAKQLKRRLIASVTLNATQDKDYYDKHIASLTNDPHVEVIQSIDLAGKNRYLKGARLLLFPLQWEEPFGLVIVESLACGTPVVAFARGSLPEIIKDGVTGFLVNPAEDDIRGDWIIKKIGLAGIAEAIERIYALPGKDYLKMRQSCRDYVLAHFSVQHMVDGYIDAYTQFLHKR